MKTLFVSPIGQIKNRYPISFALVKALQEKGNDVPVEEDYTDSYQADNEDDSAFTLGDVLGDKLKELQDNE